tara:strand:+ start:345 stop:4730 length:4386 start_codon:yes stop_codon:yes gene_type:complete
MACKYYVNGIESKLYTELYNYMDNTTPENKTVDSVYKILKGNQIAVKKGGQMYLNQSRVPYSLREVARISRRYPGLLETEYVKMTPETIYSPAAELHTLNINEIALKQIIAEGEANADLTTNDQTDIDQYVRFIAGAETNTKDYYLDELARIENTSNSKFSQMEKEDLEHTYKVANHLKESFAKAGVTVDVIFDTGIDNIGQVAVEMDTPTIRINPEKVRKDTTYHEFGHIYIDLLGVEHPMVARAIAELIDSDLYEQVKNAYPELQGEMLDKEVLATAIGLEGAKITAKNPNKIQRIINRIMRAFGKLFNATPNTAARIAEEMFAQELRADSMINFLSDVTWNQRSLQELKMQELVDESRVRIDKELFNYEQLPEDQKDEDYYIALKRLEGSLTRVDAVEDLLKLVDAMGNSLSKATQTFKTLMNLPDEAKGTPEVLNKMWALKKRIDVLDDLRSIEDLLVLSEDENKITNEGEFKKLEDRLSEILKQSRILNLNFNESIIPMWAQSVIGLSNKNIPKEIQHIIDNIKTQKRFFSPEKETIEWQSLQSRFESGEFTKEKLKEKQLNLNAEQWKERMLLDYHDLVKYLQTAHKDKTKYSYLFDPIVYSNHRGIQLLVKSVQQANLEKNDMTLDLKSKLAPVYEKFVSGQSESNIAALNDPLLEEIEVNNVPQLALVNPIDGARYEQNKKQAQIKLNKLYNKPKYSDYNKEIAVYKAALAKWAASREGMKYKQAINKWDSLNSSPIPTFKEELAALEKDIKTQNKIRRDIGQANNMSQEYINAGIRKSELESKRRKNYINGKASGEWVQPDPKIYLNEKYTAIQNNPRLKEYYDFVVKELHEAHKMIGIQKVVKNKWDKNSYLMPTYRKEDIDRMREKGVYNTIKDKLKDGFTIQQTNHEYTTYNLNNKDIEKVIPVYATNLVPANEISKDIGSSLYRFRHMAHNFKTKSGIVGQVSTFRAILKDSKTLETNAAGMEMIIKSAERMGINMPKLREGESNNLIHVEEWLDSVMFGQTNLKQDFSLFGKQISANQAVSSINSFVAMSTLSFNLLQGANQAILDNLTMLQEGFAGEFMTKSDLAWAKSEYYKSGMAILDVGKFNPKTKIGKAIEYMDALVEFTDQEGNKIVGGKIRKATKSSNALFLQQGVEHELSATRMLALMKNLEGTLKDSNGKVIMNDKGKPSNLYDLLVIDEKTGKMSIDSRVDEKESGFSRLDFITKLQGISRRTNQIKGQMHTNMLSRRWYGKLLMLFRSWMPPGIRRRYGHGGGMTGHVDEELGTVTQGMYVSFWNLVAESVQEKSFVYGKMNKIEQQNVKRAAVEFSSLLSAMALVAALANLDDEDETWISNFALYQAKRYETEILQWTPGVGTKEIFRMIQSPTATARPILKGVELLGQILDETRYFLGDPFIDEGAIFYQRKSGKYEKGDRKIKKDFMDLLPVFRGLSKSQNPRDAYKWFTTLE